MSNAVNAPPIDELLSATPATVDELCTILADRRRRHVLSVLAEERSLYFEDLVLKTAAREADEPPGDVPDWLRDRVRVALYHVHLPKMAEVGVVGYDREAGTVAVSDAKVAHEQS